MLNEMIKQTKISLILLLIMTILTGVLYPAIVTSIAQILFPIKSNGSLIQQNNKIVGSLLIGQSFKNPAYFSGRPSATPIFPYNAQQSSGSNMGPLNQDFLALVKERVDNIKKSNPAHQEAVPVELVTASASGLDPEISPQAAYYQAERIAKVRGVSPVKIQQIIHDAIQERTFGVLGERRLNVLELNLTLDNLIEG